jgi:hypothetical protein
MRYPKQRGSLVPEDAATADELTEGCAVDWSWLAGSEIVSAQSDLDSFTLTFSDSKTLVVRAAIYRGAPFLSFEPWRAP